MNNKNFTDTSDPMDCEIINILNFQPVEENTSEGIESAQQDPLDEPAPENSVKADILMGFATLSQEAPIQPARGKIVPVDHGNQQNDDLQITKIITKSVPNIVVNLENSTSDQHSVLSMKSYKLNNLIKNEVSKMSSEEEESSQHVPSPGVKLQESQIKNSGNTLSVIKTDQQNMITPTKDIANDGSANCVKVKPTKPVVNVKQAENVWCDVGVIKGSACTVKQYYLTSITDEHENISLDNLPDYTNKIKVDIESGTNYRFRVAAINACGRGEWSEVSSFKTNIPGLPGTPSNVQIVKTPKGITLTWDAPRPSCGKIVEYTVCIAIKKPIEGAVNYQKLCMSNLNFVRIYTGPLETAEASHETLSAALVDRTKAPAIIFRIAAKNENGYGLATQIRWLQERSHQ